MKTNRLASVSACVGLVLALAGCGRTEKQDQAQEQQDLRTEKAGNDALSAVDHHIASGIYASAGTAPASAAKAPASNSASAPSGANSNPQKQ